MLQVHSRSQMSHLLPPAHLFHPLPVTHHHGQGQGQHRDDDNNRDGHTAAAAASTLPPISAATSVPIYSSASTPSSAAGAPPRRMQCSLPLPPASRIASASGSAPVPSTTQSSMSAFNFSLTRQRVDSCSGDDRSTAYNLYDCSSNGSACNGAANPPADGGHDGIDRLLLFQQQQCSAAGPELIPYSTASSSAGWNTAPIHPRSSSKPHSPAPSSYSHSRKQSQEDVTPALQIPHSILTPQLNLAQLAAEVTCLFWFESHSLLQQVSGIAHLSPHMLPPLSPETRPSSSFRKWVATILAKTQVAHNVILLALLFIYRLKKLNPTVRGKSGSEVRLLTVALMLGNKFLDDNTYTNKTWAEVSGISVQEIHIMEVEFLSNMRYSLFTSEGEWRDWHVTLGRFGTFFDTASKKLPLPSPLTAMLQPTLLPPISSTSPCGLPTPPSTYERTSSPYSDSLSPAGAGHGLTYPFSHPVHLPAVAMSNCRKRSMDDQVSEPPSKRPSWRSSVSSMTSASSGATTAPFNTMSTSSSSSSAPPATVLSAQQPPRLPLPNLYIPSREAGPVPQQMHPHMIAPSAVPRAMSLVYPASMTPQHRTASSGTTLTTPVNGMSSLATPTGQRPDYIRQLSPFHRASASSSPINDGQHQLAHPAPSYASQSHQSFNLAQQATTAAAAAVAAAGGGGGNGRGGSVGTAAPGQLHGRLSPSQLLAHRNSPYRPVRAVMTLLVPPPSTAVQSAPQHAAVEQMQYHPIGRPMNERRQGPLPYLHRDAWPDSNQFNQWSSIPQDAF